MNKVLYSPFCRFSIFGCNKSEWQVLAAWAKRYQLKNKSLRWAVQMPRIYQVGTMSSGQLHA